MDLIAKKLICSRSFQISVVIIGAGAAAGAVVFLLREGEKAKCYEIARKEWGKLGSDIVVLHQPPRPPSCLSLSPFDIKVGKIIMCTPRRLKGFKVYVMFSLP